MPIGLALGLLASLFWGATDLSGALASRKVGSVGVLAGTQLTSLAILGVIAILNASLLSASAVPGFVIGLALGVVAAAAYLSFYAALRIGPISVVSPVVAAYGGLTVVLAVLFRGESLVPLQAAGSLVATAGIVLTGLELGGSLRETRIAGRGVAIALVTMVLFAVLTILLAGPIKDHGWLPVMLGSRLTNAGVGVLLLVVALVRRARDPAGRAGRDVRPRRVRGVHDRAPGRPDVAGGPGVVVRAGARGADRGRLPRRAAAAVAVAGPGDAGRRPARARGRGVGLRRRRSLLIQSPRGCYPSGSRQIPAWWVLRAVVGRPGGHPCAGRLQDERPLSTTRGVTGSARNARSGGRFPPRSTAATRVPVVA